MAANKMERPLVRRAEALRITGWAPGYLCKLVAAGVVRVFRPTMNVRAMYYREQLQELCGRKDGN